MIHNSYKFSHEDLRLLCRLCEDTIKTVVELMNTRFSSCMREYNGVFGQEYQQKIAKIYLDAKNELQKIASIEGKQLHEAEIQLHKETENQIFADYVAYVFLDPIVKNRLKNFFVKIFYRMTREFEQFRLDGSDRQYTYSIDFLYYEARKELRKILYEVFGNTDEILLESWKKEITNMRNTFLDIHSKVDILQLKEKFLLSVNTLLQK